MSANFGFNKSLNLKGIYTEGEITQGSNREKVINQIIYILILYVTHVNIHFFFRTVLSLFPIEWGVKLDFSNIKSNWYLFFWEKNSS